MSANEATPMGNRIRALRREWNISAQKLSDMTKGAVSRQVISDIENGRKQDLRLREAIAIAHVFGMSAEGLADMSIPESAWAAVQEIWKARRRLDHALATAAEVTA